MKKSIDKILRKVLGENEPAIIGGAILAGLVAVKFAVQGDFSDGLQVGEIELIAAPLIGALSYRQIGFSPATVDKIAPVEVQNRVIKHRRKKR